MLDDRRLLQLAKRVFSYWDELARLLSVAEDVISELMSDEGRSYHGAFRMLWEWREASSDPQTAVESLRTALQQLGRSDVMDQVFRRWLYCTFWAPSQFVHEAAAFCVGDSCSVVGILYRSIIDWRRMILKSFTEYISLFVFYTSLQTIFRLYIVFSGICVIWPSVRRVPIVIGVASYGALGHVPPPLNLQQFNFFSALLTYTKSDSDHMSTVASIGLTPRTTWSFPALLRSTAWFVYIVC